MPNWRKVITSGSDATLNSLTVTSGVTGSLFGTSSWSENAVTASYVLNSISSSYSATASYLNTLNQDLTFNGNLTLNGTASINYLNVIYETASVIYSSGSNQFGDATSDTQTLIGSVKVSGSLQTDGNTQITGSASILGSLAITGSVSSSLLIGTTIKPGGKLSQVRIASSGSGLVDIGEYVPGRGAIWINQQTPSATNFALTADTSNNTFFNGPSSVRISIAGSIHFSYYANQFDLGAGQLFSDLSFSSTNGTKLGILPTQKLAFWNATPVTQSISSTAIDTLIDRIGLRASGGSANFDTPITASIISGSSITGSLFGTASWAQNALTSISSSFSQTASYLNTLNQDLIFNGNLTLNGTASINYLNVIYETASVIYSSGSNQFGDSTDDIQTLIGTVKVSGSLQVTGSTTITGQDTGSTNNLLQLDVDGTGKTLGFYNWAGSNYNIFGWGIRTSADRLRIPNTIYVGDSSVILNRFTPATGPVGPYGFAISPYTDILLRSQLSTKTFLYGQQSTGNVGIATNSPRYGLDVSGSGNFTNTLTVTGSILVTQSYISTVDYIDFTTTADPAHLEGRAHWVDDTKTLNLDSDVNGFSVEVGHQSVIRVNNQTGATLTKGTIVYINGENGNRPTVATASWIGDATSAGTLGWVAQNISSGQNGYVVTDGILRGINTTAYAPGTQLYLSSSGQFTPTIPVSPLHEVRLGKTITQAVDGYVYIDIMNGYEIGELHDVLNVSASTGDLLMWDSGSQVWRNTKNLTGSYTVSGSLQLTGSLSITGSTKLNGSVSTKTYRLTSASYTASIDDYRIGVRYTDTGSVSIQLPLISQAGQIEYRFKDEEGNAQTNPITLYASGSDLIDGSTTATLQRNYIAISLYNDGTTNWYIE